MRGRVSRRPGGRDGEHPGADNYHGGEMMECPKCGKPVLETDAQCMECGARLQRAARPQEQPARPQEQELWGADQQAAPPAPVWSADAWRRSSGRSEGSGQIGGETLGERVQRSSQLLDGMAVVLQIIGVLCLLGGILGAMGGETTAIKVGAFVGCAGAAASCFAANVWAYAASTAVRLLWANMDHPGGQSR